MFKIIMLLLTIFVSLPQMGVAEQCSGEKTSVVSELEVHEDGCDEGRCEPSCLLCERSIQLHLSVSVETHLFHSLFHYLRNSSRAIFYSPPDLSLLLRPPLPLS